MKHFLLLTGIVLFLFGQNDVYAQVYGTYPKDNVTLSLLRIRSKRLRLRMGVFVSQFDPEKPEFTAFYCTILIGVTRCC